MERFLTFLMIISSSVLAGSVVGMAMTTPLAPVLCAVAAVGALWIVGDSMRCVRRVRR